MVANISFIGLNSNFDSGSLISQLVQLETQSRVLPLEIKKQELQSEKTFLDNVSSDVGDLTTEIDYDDIKDGTTSLAPKSITTTDEDEDYVAVTADDDAAVQSFDLEITQLATSTVRKSDTSIRNTLTNASAISSANFKGGVTLSDGTVTINGETRTYTEDGTPTLSDIETFLSGFSGVTGTFNTTTGKFDLTGVTSLGSPGDTSNMLEALGLNNAIISGGNVSGLKNLEAVTAATELFTLGVTGTTLTVNGQAITYDPSSGGDTIQDLLDSINNSASAKVDASFDALNGEIILTNTDTGALSLTVSSDGDASALNLNNASSETLGNNAEFSISTLYGGATLSSNSNTVEGLIAGVTLELKDETTSPITIGIAEDSSGYKDRMDAILTEVNGLLSRLKDQNDSFSRGFISRIKTTLTKIVGVSGTDTYTSFIELGLKSQLDGEGNFTGYTIDDDLFDAAFDAAPDEMNKTLWGDSTDTDSIFSSLSNGDKGIMVQLVELLNSYVDPDVSTNGIIYQVKDSIDNQIDSVDDSIERAEASIESMEIRLRKQFAQLDVINSQYQQQQAAVAGLVAQTQQG